MPILLRVLNAEDAEFGTLSALRILEKKERKKKGLIQIKRSPPKSGDDLIKELLAITG